MQVSHRTRTMALPSSRLMDPGPEGLDHLLGANRLQGRSQRPSPIVPHIRLESSSKLKSIRIMQGGQWGRMQRYGLKPTQVPSHDTGVWGQEICARFWGHPACRSCRTSRAKARTELEGEEGGENGRHGRATMEHTEPHMGTKWPRQRFCTDLNHTPPWTERKSHASPSLSKLC